MTRPMTKKSKYISAFRLEFYTFLGTAPLLHWCRQSGPNNCVHKGFDAARERERLGSPRGFKNYWAAFLRTFRLGPDVRVINVAAGSFRQRPFPDCVVPSSVHISRHRLRYHLMKFFGSLYFTGSLCSLQGCTDGSFHCIPLL